MNNYKINITQNDRYYMHINLDDISKVKAVYNKLMSQFTKKDDFEISLVIEATAPIKKVIIGTDYSENKEYDRLNKLEEINEKVWECVAQRYITK